MLPPMDSPRTRALIGVAALVVVIALFLVLKGGDDDETTTSATSTTAAETTTTGGQTTDDETTTVDAEVPTIVIKDGQPVGGVQELSFSEGGEIRFTVDSDVSDEVHFHGYDVGKDVEAGGSVTFDVPATSTGVFEVELEERVVPIAEITVNPS
jgi:hypothetical protein